MVEITLPFMCIVHSGKINWVKVLIYECIKAMKIVTIIDAINAWKIFPQIIWQNPGKYTNKTNSLPT